jgi:hypothetical protein
MDAGSSSRFPSPSFNQQFFLYEGEKTIFKLGGCSHRQISSHVLFPSLFLSITHQGEKRRRRRRKVPAHPIPPERLPIRALMRFPFGEMLMIVTDRFHIRPLIVCLFF